jgi:hypothetical protein
MANTKRPALAPGCIVDLTALHEYNTTNFVQYRKHEAGSRPQAEAQAKSSSSSVKQQATSNKQQAPKAQAVKTQAAKNNLV